MINNNDDTKNLENDKNKFIKNWAEDESPEQFAGDEQTDKIVSYNDFNDSLSLRMTSPAGGIFMHPIHDVTLDNYSNELDDYDEEKNKE
ncbi:hypothetical protein BHF71_10925 [Vulcanibacillus modesticaldus]|uniref:Uncharacterized protein n=1 Tax=Vulcanibacillus modesticaldus TaxID=337097 RepID=A0A1D2YSN9_9BACI|nr:hypothetical protein [Vulcanibacillus modesticaldus]OEF97890.1 hypothetical protein BHF71_10925 [Vulcanibacillus modesticaldus]